MSPGTAWSERVCPQEQPGAGGCDPRNSLEREGVCKLSPGVRRCVPRNSLERRPVASTTAGPVMAGPLFRQDLHVHGGCGFVFYKLENETEECKLFRDLMALHPECGMLLRP